jgi:hypothetical protein
MNNAIRKLQSYGEDFTMFVPFTGPEVEMILGLTKDQYVMAIESGELRSTAMDQSERLSWRSFHTFWDIVEYMARNHLVLMGQHTSWFRQGVSDACDDLHLAIFADDDILEPNGIEVLHTDQYPLSMSSCGKIDRLAIQSLSTSVERDGQYAMEVVLYCVERVLVRIIDLISQEQNSHYTRQSRAVQLCLPFDAPA